MRVITPRLRLPVVLRTIAHCPLYPLSRRLALRHAYNRLSASPLFTRANCMITQRPTRHIPYSPKCLPHTSIIAEFSTTHSALSTWPKQRFAQPPCPYRHSHLNLKATF